MWPIILLAIWSMQLFAFINSTCTSYTFLSMKTICSLQIILFGKFVFLQHVKVWSLGYFKIFEFTIFLFSVTTNFQIVEMLYRCWFLKWKGTGDKWLGLKLISIIFIIIIVLKYLIPNMNLKKGLFWIVLFNYAEMFYGLMLCITSLYLISLVVKKK